MPWEFAAIGKRIVLIGAGHAHLLLLRRAGRFRRDGHALTVIAPRWFWYSGLATAVLNGERAPEEDRVDVRALARRAGAAFVEDEAAGLDRASGRVRLRGGGTVPFDLLSVAVGSTVAPLPGAEAWPDTVFAAKPIGRLPVLRAALDVCFARGKTPRVVVAGGGVSAAELAASVAGLAERRGGRAAVTLLHGDGPLVPQLGSGGRRLRRVLAGRGVAARRGHALTVEGGVLRTSGAALPFDLLVLATGLRPPPVLGAFGLPLAHDGALLVDACLRSTGDPRVFGAGDCVRPPGPALPRAGVFAVREAPVLLHNLLSAARGGALRPFRPPGRFLWIMNLGDGTGMASWGGLRLWGRAALWWKNRLDDRFLRRFRRSGRRIGA